ncbi:MAG: hypothetical protein U0271_35665 [Polyangiaceae bacterium]
MPESVRRAWTLLDRAYTECRHTITFLRRREGDADDIAPSMRRNLGVCAPGAAARASTTMRIAP